MLHPSLLLLVFDGHFETIPDIDVLIDVSVLTILPHIPIKDEEFDRLTKFFNSATSSAIQENISVDDDTTLINDPGNNISNFRKPRTRTLANSVFTQCLNPLLCAFASHQ